jgi:Thrombospondin type 1 domain
MRILGLLALALITVSCDNVNFKSETKNDVTATDCQGNNCPQGAYSWFQGGWGGCSLACGSGTQTQVVECRRNSDNVAVADGFCSSPRPDSVRSCNTQACPGNFNWNIGQWGSCSRACGGGTRTRQVVCQNTSGSIVADSNCPSPKPGTQEACNTDPCSTFTYSWFVTPGQCSKVCGGGTATDTVVCRRNDGATVTDVMCDAATRPPTQRSCNTDPCPPDPFTYTWEPGAWSVCSRQCGPGVQTRSMTCRRSDGLYVSTTLCNAATRPAVEQACQIQACPPTGRAVTQSTLVPAASNSVDVIVIVDDSSSMKEDQDKLALRLGGLLTDLDDLNIDYQVCLTTTDISYYKGSPIMWQGLNSFVMRKNSPNKTTVFRNTIGALGAEWSSDEQGIKAMHLMIRDYRNTGCLRPEATLATILISDENERSVGGNRSWSSVQYQPLTPENMPANLINYVHSTFSTSTFRKPFIWNSIIVKPGDRVCESQQDRQSSPSFFGTLYAELSNSTGGHVGSICDADYTQNLRFIRERVVNSMPGLTMECTPIDVPIVTFDRAVSTTVSVSGNQLRFTPAVPEGVRITARYTCPN